MTSQLAKVRELLTSEMSLSNPLANTSYGSGECSVTPPSGIQRRVKNLENAVLHLTHIISKMKKNTQEALERTTSENLLSRNKQNAWNDGEYVEEEQGDSWAENADYQSAEWGENTEEEENAELEYHIDEVTGDTYTFNPLTGQTEWV